MYQLVSMYGNLKCKNQVTMEHYILHMKEILAFHNYLCKTLVTIISENFVKSELYNANLWDDPKLDY